MNAPAQLSMFEPDAVDATRLCSDYLRQAHKHAEAADRFELLQMHGACAQAERQMLACVDQAQVLAMYLDLLEAAL